MLVTYTRHSRKRMRWRKIDQADVELVLTSSDRIEPSGEGRINACKMLGGRLLKVICFQI